MFTFRSSQLAMFYKNENYEILNKILKKLSAFVESIFNVFTGFLPVISQETKLLTGIFERNYQKF